MHHSTHTGEVYGKAGSSWRPWNWPTSKLNSSKLDVMIAQLPLQGPCLWVALKAPEGRLQRGWRQVPCSGAQDKRQCAQTGTQEATSEHQEALPYCMDYSALEQVAQTGCRWSWATCCCCWSRWPPRIPSKLNHSVICENKGCPSMWARHLHFSYSQSTAGSQCTCPHLDV